MRTKKTPARVASGTGVGEGRLDDTPNHSKNDANTLARPIFVLRLEPLPGIDGHKALRELLKRARRNHGLRCVACHEEASQ